MPRFLRRRPSPSLVISLLALFVALGGSSYAALHVGSKQIVNNSVRSKDIRNNDVRSKDIRNSTTLGKDVKNNTLTGADVRESSLGQVPVAASALNASTLGGLGPSAFLPASKLVSSGGIIKLTKNGATATLATIGPFKITGKCSDAGGGNTMMQVGLSSTEAGSMLNGGPSTNVPDVFDATSTGSAATGNNNQNLDMAAPSGIALSIPAQLGVNSLGAACWAAFDGIR